MAQREPLSSERIVHAAVAVADRGGFSAISMRNVAKELGVEAMSIYHHLANKDALLDALADWIFAQMELPGEDQSWRSAMTLRAASARKVLVKHSWSLTLINSRSNPGPALLRHHDAVIGCLLRGGFPMDLAAHAYSVIDAYVFGFALTERTLPFDPSAGDEASDFVRSIEDVLAAYPNLAAMAIHLTSAGDYKFADEFDIGLDIILDELERRVEGATP